MHKAIAQKGGASALLVLVLLLAAPPHQEAPAGPVPDSTHSHSGIAAWRPKGEISHF